MSSELHDHEFGAPHAPTEADTRPVPHNQERAVRFMRRLATRLAWHEHPVVRLRHIVEDDALIVEILPLQPADDRVVDDLLCIEFDGTDSERLPTSLCLTGFVARPDSAAAQAARHLLGETLCRAADEIVLRGETEREVLLDESVRDSRIRTWRRLTGLAIGIEILPSELQTVLVGADGEIIARYQQSVAARDPDAVIEAITDLVTRIQADNRSTISASPLFLGVQIGGPVDSARGIVCDYLKYDNHGGRARKWRNVPLAELLERVTGLRCLLLNDVVAYATYERWLDPAPGDSVRGVLLMSQGIGAKIIVGDEVLLRLPTEVGMMIVNKVGRRSGNRGEIEATAGTHAIIRRVSVELDRPVESVREAVSLAEPESGPVNEAVVEIFRDAGRDLARGIASAQAIAAASSWAVYGPSALLMKGSKAGDAFLKSLKGFKRWVAYKKYRKCAIYPRPLEGAEGAHGAALAALEKFEIACLRYDLGE